MLGTDKTKLILLPRGYLSYSQWQCWKSSPARYRREYFEKSSKLDTKYLRFGSAVAKMIEDGTHHDLLPGLPVYDKREYEFDEVLTKGGFSVRILGRLDGFDEPFGVIGEYKTGKIPWSAAKVQKHEQFPFYASGIRLKLGWMPSKGILQWIETLDSPKDDGMLGQDSKVLATGRIETFERTFDERELERIEVDMVTVALEIQEAYISYLSEL